MGSAASRGGRTPSPGGAGTPAPAHADRAVPLKSRHFSKVHGARSPDLADGGDGVCARPGPRGAGLTEQRVTDEAARGGVWTSRTLLPSPRREGVGRRERDTDRTRGRRTQAPPAAQRAARSRSLSPEALAPGTLPSAAAGPAPAGPHREPALQELVSGRPSSAASRALACRWARAALECRHLGEPQRQLNSLPLMSQKRCP